jgi:ribonuclease HI
VSDSASPAPGDAITSSAANPYVVIFDGGALGNPGKGYGSYVLDSPTGERIQQSIEYPVSEGPMTNNQAEYRTLIEALRHLRELLGDRAASETVRIEGDSQLVLFQLNGSWKVRNQLLKGLHARARDLLEAFGDVEFAWHPRARSVRILGH